VVVVGQVRFTLAAFARFAIERLRLFRQFVRRRSQAAGTREAEVPLPREERR